MPQKAKRLFRDSFSRGQAVHGHARQTFAGWSSAKLFTRKEWLSRCLKAFPSAEAVRTGKQVLFIHAGTDL